MWAQLNPPSRAAGLVFFGNIVDESLRIRRTACILSRAYQKRRIRAMNISCGNLAFAAAPCAWWTTSAV
jgi:hypothetical protein